MDYIVKEKIERAMSLAEIFNIISNKDIEVIVEKKPEHDGKRTWLKKSDFYISHTNWLARINPLNTDVVLSVHY